LAFPTGPTMRRQQVERAILERLAANMKRDPTDLESELKAGGEELPVDSLEMVEIILDLEERFDVRLPDDTATAEAMRSVRALAERICQVAAQRED